MNEMKPSDLPRELVKNLDRNLCVCYDVPKQEVINAYHDGFVTFEEITAKTYACQGSGCCEHQLIRLIELLDENYANS